ncbi:MAG TPA: amino acid ABC transporter permease [Enterovirga sp.]
MTRAASASPRNGLPVLLPYRVPEPARFAGGIAPGMLVACIIGAVLLVDVAAAQTSARPSGSIPALLVRWAPLLLQGFALNLLISAFAMAIGTAAGLALGLAQISRPFLLRKAAWTATQFFRNAPWLVLLFFVMFLVPFQVRIGGMTIPLPDSMKATIGFALPVMANMSEILRGAVRSVPTAQWEAADSLAFTPRQTMWMIILPQCVKRMIPPWMNLYSLVTMATVQASIVGVTEMLTLTSEVHAAEGSRPELFAPLYGFALLCFFLYCYPIDRWTARLERRFGVA